ncbi:RND transporter [Luteitalea sp. TBR-22]|nr:RND transporter [Luteitalea sp. TBR-22]
MAREVHASGTTRYSATIDAATRVDLSFRVGGYVRALGVVDEGGVRRPLRDGDPVRKGQALATIDQTDGGERVKQGRAQLAEATAAAAQAERSLARARGLFEKDALTRPEFEAAQTAAEAARARVTAAEAAVRQVEAVAGDATLVAPFDGILLRKQVSVGALAMPGQPAFTLADITTVKVVFGVPDVALATVRQSVVEVEADAFPGVTFPARLTHVSPVADPRGRVFDVELAIANGDGRLRPGMVASVGLREADAGPPEIVIPLAAITRPPGASSGYAVYVVQGQGDATRVAQRTIEIGELRGNEVTVRRGLARGDRVVVSGTTMVTDGAPVRVVL